MGANVMRSTDFRSVVEPILNEVFDGIYEQRADEWKGFVNETSGIARAYHEEPVLYGFSSAPEIPDGEAVSYQAGGTLYVKRYQYKVFGTAYALTKVLVEDGDHIRIGTIFSEQSAQAMIETKEIRTANLLNRAFTSGYTGGDGKVLCASDHPVIGGSQSNILSVAAALSQTSLEQQLINVRSAKDSNGKNIRLTPQRLVIPTSQVFQAEVLLKSVLRAGTANNDINPIKSMGLIQADPAVVSRMTSTTAWFIKTGVPKGLQLKMRRRLTRSMEGDFETDSMKYKVTERYIEGWTDWRDIWGTPGV